MSSVGSVLLVSLLVSVLGSDEVASVPAHALRSRAQKAANIAFENGDTVIDLPYLDGVCPWVLFTHYHTRVVEVWLSLHFTIVIRLHESSAFWVPSPPMRNIHLVISPLDLEWLYGHLYPFGSAC